MAVAAPVLEAEMADWVKLGGGNSGIVGDSGHTYGFHRAANEIGPDDYSRWRDPQGSDGPYPNWNWACAGDFYHGGREHLRGMHRNVLARLMRGELPMVCEFIGQPWADQPVYYWARWNGLTKLLRYTGAGHTLWSHLSLFRSMADQRPHFWTAAQPTRQEDDMERRVRSGAGDGSIYLVPGWRAPSGLWAAYGLDGPTNARYEYLPLVQLPGGMSVAAAGLYDVTVGRWSTSTPPKPEGPAAVDYAKLAAEVAKVLPKPPTPDEIANELRDRLAG